MNNKILIQADQLSKTYYSGAIPLPVLKNIQLSIESGEIVSIIGESGSGKSTLLNLLGGLDSVSSGQIHIYGNPIHKMSEDDLAVFRNKYIGFIFQFHHLLPDFTAVENVMLPFLARKFKKNAAKEKAMKLLKDVRLENRADHRPNQLSGGEQQRVAIARSLVNDPLILFADEPTGNLDERNTSEIQELLWSLREQYHLTLVLVTHNLRIAREADRMIRLSYGEIEDVIIS